MKFSKEIGASHTINHRVDIVQQIKDLKLSTPIRYVFITHMPADKYIKNSAAICAPFARVCSIVQMQDISVYGTERMSKSWIYVWELMGTKPYYGVDADSHGKILARLAELPDNKTVKCHHTQTLPFNLEDVKKAYEQIEAIGQRGELALSVDAEGLTEENEFQ